MTNAITNPRTVLWPASLATASVLGSFALACVFPFAAIAALAAMTMRPMAGLALVAAAWAANQFVGFFVLSFPWEAQAVGHGLAIFAATAAAYGVARLVADRIKIGSAFRSVAALVSAFTVYQVLLRSYAQFGGGAENFSAEIIADVARNDALWFAGLMLLRFALSAVTGEKPLPATA
jgi:hypothetical protein